MMLRGADCMGVSVGVGEGRVRDLFQPARKEAPAIIFIDEIDSIGRKRGAGLGGGHDEREQTLNQLLSEMDGFETTEGIVIMAATNRPDILDPALLRPGRFDRQITVPLPTQEERLEILRVHTNDKTLDPSADLVTVSRGTPGFSGADLSNLCNEAALFAVRVGRKYITSDDFDDARDRILMGQRRDSMAISEKEKEIIAYHEGGHAVLAYLLPHADPLHKVTILATGRAPQAMGHVACADEGHQVHLGEEIARGHEYSDDTARVIDEEVARILSEMSERAEQELIESRAALDALAQALLEKETISGEEAGHIIDGALGRPMAAATPVEPQPEPAQVEAPNV